MEDKEFLRSIWQSYSSRLELKDKAIYEQINMALIKLKFTKTVHCNSCGMGQRDIWNELKAWIEHN